MFLNPCLKLVSNIQYWRIAGFQWIGFYMELKILVLFKFCSSTHTYTKYKSEIFLLKL
jgi:hypothetical protein